MFLLLFPFVLVWFASTVLGGTAFVLSFTHRRYAWYVPVFALSVLFVGALGIFVGLIKRTSPFGLFWLLLVLGIVSLARWSWRR